MQLWSSQTTMRHKPCAVIGHAAADLVEATKLLDFNVQQLAGTVALWSPRGLIREQVAPSGQPRGLSTRDDGIHDAPLPEQQALAGQVLVELGQDVLGQAAVLEQMAEVQYRLSSGIGSPRLRCAKVRSEASRTALLLSPGHSARTSSASGEPAAPTPAGTACGPGQPPDCAARSDRAAPSTARLVPSPAETLRADSSSAYRRTPHPRN